MTKINRPLSVAVLAVAALAPATAAHAATKNASLGYAGKPPKGTPESAMFTDFFPRKVTIHAGDKAPAAAGVIHTDFEKGFIKAEVIRHEDLLELKSEAACREKGKLRIEGKEYVVQDGDVMHFRFNV